MAKPVDLVIFGASGDLTHRKLLPSLGHLVARDSQNVRVIGVGRSPKSTEDFRAYVKDASGSESLAATAEWIHLDYAEPATFAPLKQIVEGPPTTIFYLATPAETFSTNTRSTGPESACHSGTLLTTPPSTRRRRRPLRPTRRACPTCRRTRRWAIS